MAANSRITIERIRKHFGPRASVRRTAFGGYRIATPSGGEVEFTQKNFNIHCGGDDVYAATMALAAEAWGGVEVQGPSEHIIASMAHGDALGINVIPEVKGSGGCLRFFIAAIAFIVGVGIAARTGTDVDVLPALFVGGAAAVVMWKYVKKIQKRNARRRAQPYRFQYPQAYGDDRTASHDEARDKGWL